MTFRDLLGSNSGQWVSIARIIPAENQIANGFGTYLVRGEVIYGCAQFLQVKWLWEDRLHVQPLIGFADFGETWAERR